jgi:hypothetical protein
VPTVRQKHAQNGYETASKAVESVEVDVGFLIERTFYYGPENGFTQEQWQQLREPLYQPTIELYGNLLLSADMRESVAELVPYYQDVERLIVYHMKKMGQQSHYFWMRPLIFTRGEFAITFPWYDTWEEAVPMLDALTALGDGQLFHDLDQGWEFHAFADGDQLVLRQGDLDSGKEHIVILHAARNRAFPLQLYSASIDFSKGYGTQ